MCPMRKLFLIGFSSKFLKLKDSILHKEQSTESVSVQLDVFFTEGVHLSSQLPEPEIGHSRGPRLSVPPAPPKGIGSPDSTHGLRVPSLSSKS